MLLNHYQASEFLGSLFADTAYLLTEQCISSKECNKLHPGHKLLSFSTLICLLLCKQHPFCSEALKWRSLLLIYYFKYKNFPPLSCSCAAPFYGSTGKTGMELSATLFAQLQKAGKFFSTSSQINGTFISINTYKHHFVFILK